MTDIFAKFLNSVAYGVATVNQGSTYKIPADRDEDSQFVIATRGGFRRRREGKEQKNGIEW